MGARVSVCENDVREVYNKIAGLQKKMEGGFL